MRVQRALASVVYDGKRKVTSRERVLTEMDRVMPWTPLRALISPHDPKAEEMLAASRAPRTGISATARVFTTFALASLYVVRHTLSPQRT